MPLPLRRAPIDAAATYDADFAQEHITPRVVPDVERRCPAILPYATAADAGTNDIRTLALATEAAGVTPEGYTRGGAQSEPIPRPRIPSTPPTDPHRLSPNHQGHPAQAHGTAISMSAPHLPVGPISTTAPHTGGAQPYRPGRDLRDRAQSRQATLLVSRPQSSGHLVVPPVLCSDCGFDAPMALAQRHVDLGRL